jgi:hypothetical protein
MGLGARSRSGVADRRPRRLAVSASGVLGPIQVAWQRLALTPGIDAVRDGSHTVGLRSGAAVSAVTDAAAADLDAGADRRGGTRMGARRRRATAVL